MDKLKKLAVEMRTYAEKLDDTEPNLASVFHDFTDGLDAFIQRSTPEPVGDQEGVWISGGRVYATRFLDRDNDSPPDGFYLFSGEWRELHGVRLHPPTEPPEQEPEDE